MCIRAKARPTGRLALRLAGTDAAEAATKVKTTAYDDSRRIEEGRKIEVRRDGEGLFLGLPHGHTNPSLPLVRALVDRRWRILTGPFAAESSKPARDAVRIGTFLADLRQLADARTNPWLLMRTTAGSRPGPGGPRRTSDYIISDSVAPWGQWVAELLDVPVVTSVTTFAVNRHVVGFAAARGTRPKSARLVLSKIRHVAKAAWLRRRLRRDYGVKGTSMIGLMFGSSDLNIVYTSRLFQPCAESFDDRFLFIGPSIGSRTGAAGLPWDEASQTDVIYISLGTLFNADPAFYRS